MTFSKNFRQEIFQSADSTKGRHSKNRTSTQKEQPPNNKYDNFACISKNKSEMFRNSKAQKQVFNDKMKQIIAQNAGYFQHKIRVTDKVKPNEYRFKIPTSTGKSLYKCEFRKKSKNLSVDNLKLNSNTFLSCNINCKFEGKTTYGNQFRGVNGQKCRILAIKTNSWIDEDAPRFLQTQNKCDFLNWGGRNIITSMKPAHQIATTYAPFMGKTSYETEFQEKLQPQTKSIVPECSIFKSRSRMMIKQSCYGSHFANKENNIRDSSCKPKEFLVKNNNKFKGSTEYRQEYLRDKAKFKEKATKNMVSQPFTQKERTVVELQALILDL